METPGRALLFEVAKQQLEAAISCLDELGCHQAAAYADMALNLLVPQSQMAGSAPDAAADDPPPS